jgi:MoxR-like ATPase
MLAKTLLVKEFAWLVGGTFSIVLFHKGGV